MWHVHTRQKQAHTQTLEYVCHRNLQKKKKIYLVKKQNKTP